MSDERARVWWYVLAGEFGARQWVGRRKCDKAEALEEIAKVNGCPTDWIAQYWPFRKGEDLYNKAVYKRGRW